MIINMLQVFMLQQSLC